MTEPRLQSHSLPSHAGLDGSGVHNVNGQIDDVGVSDASFPAGHTQENGVDYRMFSSNRSDFDCNSTKKCFLFFCVFLYVYLCVFVRVCIILVVFRVGGAFVRFLHQTPAYPSCSASACPATTGLRLP